MSGLSRTPGKRVGVNSPPRVRIPLSPPPSPSQSPACRGFVVVGQRIQGWPARRQNGVMQAHHYLAPADAPTRAAIDTTPGLLLLEFGTGWCGHCRAAQPAVAEALAAHPGVRHLQVEDGPGRALGRSFGVTLWPTLVFLHDGQERQRMVRPRDAGPVAAALHALTRG